MRSLRNLLLLTGFTLSLLYTNIGFTDEGALYGRQVPHNAALVRIFHADTTNPSPISGDMGGKTFASVDPFSATPYYFFVSDTIMLNAAGFSHSVALNPKSAYTAVLTKKGFQVIEDSVFTNQRKALVSFYNLVEAASLDLKANQGKITVIEGVKPGERKERPIKAMKLAFSIHEKTKQIAETSPIVLNRGEVSSLFVYGEGTSPRSVWVDFSLNTAK